MLEDHKDKKYHYEQLKRALAKNGAMLDTTDEIEVEPENFSMIAMKDI